MKRLRLAVVRESGESPQAAGRLRRRRSSWGGGGALVSRMSGSLPTLSGTDTRVVSVTKKDELAFSYLYGSRAMSTADRLAEVENAMTTLQALMGAQEASIEDQKKALVDYMQSEFAKTKLGMGGIVEEARKEFGTQRRQM